MVSKNDVDKLVREIRATPGYTCEVNGGGHYTVTAPGGDFMQLSATPSDPNWRVKAIRELKRDVGWTTDLADELRKREAQKAMGAVRIQETEDLQRAQELADERQRQEVANERQAQARISRQRTLDELTKAKEAAERARSLVATQEVARQALHEVNVGAMPTADDRLAGYPTVARYMTIPEIREAVDLNKGNRCNTRPLYEQWIDKWYRAMARGAWYLSPEPVIHDEHGCAVDGNHRYHAALRLAEENPEALAQFYPHGIPFTVVSEFPSAMVKILNGGKSRSARDVLGVAGHTKNSFQVAAGLRLVVAYDGGTPWTRWSALRMDNDEIDAAIEGPYARLPEQGSISSRLRRKVRMAPAASYVLPFLLERDGHSEEDARKFLEGICLETEMRQGDPRGTLGLALLRRAPERTESGALRKGRATANKDAQKSTGAHQLCMALKAYYKWQVGETMQIADFGSNEKAYAVWRPDMKLIKGEVRVPYRTF